MKEVCHFFVHEKQGRRSVILPCKREAVGTVTTSESNWWDRIAVNRITDVPACREHLKEYDQ